MLNLKKWASWIIILWKETQELLEITLFQHIHFWEMHARWDLPELFPSGMKLVFDVCKTLRDKFLRSRKLWEGDDGSTAKKDPDLTNCLHQLNTVHSLWTTTSVRLASMSTTLNVTWQSTAGLKQWGTAVGVLREIAKETGKCVRGSVEQQANPLRLRCGLTQIKETPFLPDEWCAF